MLRFRPAAPNVTLNVTMARKALYYGINRVRPDWRSQKKCEHCGDPIPYPRPRRSVFCSNACKQAAYRTRTAGTPAKHNKG